VPRLSIEFHIALTGMDGAFERTSYPWRVTLFREINKVGFERSTFAPSL
jgi:hypothetical protein